MWMLDDFESEQSSQSRNGRVTKFDWMSQQNKSSSESSFHPASLEGLCRSCSSTKLLRSTDERRWTVHCTRRRRLTLSAVGDIWPAKWRLALLFSISFRPGSKLAPWWGQQNKRWRAERPPNPSVASTELKVNSKLLTSVALSKLERASRIGKIPLLIFSSISEADQRNIRSIRKSVSVSSISTLSRK